MKTIFLSSIALLITWSDPVAAQGQPSALREVIAEACAASDADLVGKRLERECRASLSDQARTGARTLNWSKSGRAVELAVTREGRTEILLAAR